MLGSIFGGIGGSILDGALGLHSASRQRSFARDEAQKTRDFLERMSSTAHQRQVDDLRAAGLNPILSATGGSGAAATGGAMAPTPESDAAGISAASSARAVREQINNIREQNKNLRAERDRIKADTAFTHERTRREAADATRAEVMRTPFTMAQPYLSAIGNQLGAIGDTADIRAVRRFGASAKDFILNIRRDRFDHMYPNNPRAAQRSRRRGN